MAAAPQQSQALMRPAKDAGELRALFARKDVLDQVKLTLPKHMHPERLTKVMLSSVLQTPNLMKCNQLTLMQALTKLSEIGLEPGSALGHVYLIPFENRKASRWDVNVIIGYRGYIELARRSGSVLQIESHVVFDQEEFELVYGLDDVRKLRHVPKWNVPRTPETALIAYCIARLRDGAAHVEPMGMEEIRGIRNRSQAWKYKPGTGPWAEDFLEMARKTVLRRAAKYLPLSPELANAMALDDDNGETVEGEVVRPSLAPVNISTADDIANQMAPAEEEAPPHDPTTGEVVPEPGADTEPVKTPGTEPEKGTMDHLLWRIENATAEQLPDLVKEAAALPKDEPRRLDVGKAIAERRKAVGQ